MALSRIPRLAMVIILIAFVAATALAQAGLIHLATAASHAGLDGWSGRHALRPLSLSVFPLLSPFIPATVRISSPPGV